MAYTTVCATFVLISFVVIRLRSSGRRERGLPPGPNGIPILGNALQFPRSFPHLQFTEWAAEFGEIYSLKLFNRTAIVLSGPDAIKVILDTKGSVTGNRVQSHVIQKVTDGLIFSLEDMSTNLWKKGRKIVTSFMTAEALEQHRKTQESESLQFLHDIIESPKDIFTHTRRLTASTMTSLVYGQRFPQYHNSVPEAYFEGIKLLNQAADPGAHPPVDIFPILKLFPGEWKELCKRAKKVRDEVYWNLLKTCEDNLRDGNGGDCLIGKVILEREEHGLEWREIYGVGANLMDAGAETTASYLQSVIMAMITYPEFQMKAQEEIDQVVGDRMPTLDDLNNLPYVQAFLKEVMRFTPILPIGAPHVSIEEVVYKGYIIPKDSIIFQNTWGVFHNPNLFPDHNKFKPERHLNLGEPGSKVRENLVFGSGRRICPGEQMAMQVVPSNIMKLLWAFTFEIDDSGTGILGMDAFAKPGIALTPLPFTCKVEVRNQKRTVMIEEMFGALFADAV